MRGLRKWAGKIARFGVLLVITIVAAELALHLAAWVIGKRRASKTGWATSNMRVLTLGDSNTYGLWLADQARAYPTVFQTLWNADARRPAVEVVNLGYPGMNSSRVRRDLPRLIQVFHPDVIFVMVGANDYWTSAVPVTAASAWQRFEWRLWNLSRIYRLGYMVRQAITRPKLEKSRATDGSFARTTGTARYGGAEFELGWEERKRDVEIDGNLLSDTLQRNLVAAAETTAAARVKLVILTYPSEAELYALANRAMRSAAASANIPLVDLGQHFRAFCPEHKCAELYTDQHPTETGHARAATELVKQLSERRLVNP